MGDGGPRYAGLITARARVLAGVVALVLLGWLVLGAMLVPDGSGMGTHRQVGLPPCGWIVAFSRPCPTCGMTTAFSNAVQGRWWEAAKGQPFAAVLAVGVAAGFWGCLYTAVSGVGAMSVYAFLLRPRWVWAMLGLLAVSGGYKLITT